MNETALYESFFEEVVDLKPVERILIFIKTNAKCIESNIIYTMNYVSIGSDQQIVAKAMFSRLGISGRDKKCNGKTTLKFYFLLPIFYNYNIIKG